MSIESPISNLDIISQMRQGVETVKELAAAFGVTATPIRRRLDKLMHQGEISREPHRSWRAGRPCYVYRLKHDFNSHVEELRRKVIAGLGVPKEMLRNIDDYSN